MTIINGIKKSGEEEELDDLPLESDEEKYYNVLSTSLSKGVKGRIGKFNSKQTINKPSNIISTNKSLK